MHSEVQYGESRRGKVMLCVAALALLALLFLAGTGLSACATDAQGALQSASQARNANGSLAIDSSQGAGGAKDISPDASGDTSGASAQNTSAVDTSAAALDSLGAAPEQSYPDAPQPSPNTKVIDIPERVFVEQINDIYLNPYDYLGKYLRFEGAFSTYEVEEWGVHYYMVTRIGPGCCGNDANPGFEIRWEGNEIQPDDWVEVCGILEEYEEYGHRYLRLNTCSLKALDARGAEVVA
jgi:hypothetical protein